MVSRTLRRLHVRLWHAPAQRMHDLCDRAGVPKTALRCRHVQSMPRMAATAGTSHRGDHAHHALQRGHP
eukprot:5988372-Heterocapsa_arctica.AAC.1